MSVLGGEDAPFVVLTGPTGGGKSTVAGWLAQRGAFVLDADRIGHELLLDPAIRDRIVESFGPEHLDPAGQIDRARLGAAVFADPAALKALNEIIHPAIGAEIERRVGRLRRSRGVPLIVLDAALYFQFPSLLPCDLVVGVSVDAETRKKRIMQRDGLSEQAAAERIERQADVVATLERAALLLSTDRAPEILRGEFYRMLDEALGLRLSASDPTGPPPNTTGE